MAVVIEERVGKGQANMEGDVRLVKIMLNRLGYYYPDPDEGITGQVDEYFVEAVKNFQNAKFLSVDGQVHPEGGVMRFLNDELDNPDNFMLFRGSYIWRTVEDKKVRGVHKAREGRQFSWSDPPDGGHPGEDYGCRCWAEPIVPMVPKGLNVGLPELLTTQEELDAIEKSVSPFDIIGGAIAIIRGGVVLLGSAVIREGGKSVLKDGKKATAAAARVLIRHFRDTKWIDRTPKRKMQKKFDRHKDVFGIKENRNNETLGKFKQALKDHVKNKDTVIIKGSYRRQDAIHYYNPKTDINVMKHPNGNFWSAWKLTKDQKMNILKRGAL